MKQCHNNNTENKATRNTSLGYMFLVVIIKNTEDYSHKSLKEVYSVCDALETNPALRDYLLGLYGY